MAAPESLDVGLCKDLWMLEHWKRFAGQPNRETYGLYLAYRDPRMSRYAKASSALLVEYAFSPIDLIPDLIPILGCIDDLILIPIGFYLALKMIPPVVLEESRARVQLVMEQGKPVNKAAAAMVAIWVLLAGAIAVAVYRLVLR